MIQHCPAFYPKGAHMQQQLMSYLILVVAIAVGIVCLVAVGWQFRSSNAPANQTERIKRSVLVGLLANGSLLSMLVISIALDTDFQWSVSALAGSLCLFIPVQIVVSVGAYVQFGYLPWMQQQRLKAVTRNSEIHDETHPKT